MKTAHSRILLCVLLLGAGLFSQCTKNDTGCPFVAPKMVFVDYYPHEVDTLIIRKFQKGSGFSQLIDTILISQAHMVWEAVGQDSLAFSTPKYPELQSDFYRYDWQIYIPEVQHTVGAYDISTTFNRESREAAQCKSFVSSVFFDGRIYKFLLPLDPDYRVYTQMLRSEP